MPILARICDSSAEKSVNCAANIIHCFFNKYYNNNHNYHYNSSTDHDYNCPNIHEANHNHDNYHNNSKTHHDNVNHHIHYDYNYHYHYSYAYHHDSIWKTGNSDHTNLDCSDNNYSEKNHSWANILLSFYSQIPAQTVATTTPKIPRWWPLAGSGSTEQPWWQKVQTGQNTLPPLFPVAKRVEEKQEKVTVRLELLGTWDRQEQS